MHVQPIHFSPGVNVNDENSGENLSPMQVTPNKKEADRIVRSPLKRNRVALSPLREEYDSDTSPRKKRAFARSSTVPTRLFPAPQDSGTVYPSKSTKSSLSRSLGRKAATSVRNMFNKEKKRNQLQLSTSKFEEEEKLRTLKASMLAMLLVHKIDMPLVQGLITGVNVVKLEELAEELFDFFDGHNQIKHLIDFMVKNEVQNTSSYPTLFRETSCATKLIGIVFKREGQSFLADVMYPHIKDMVENSNDYEVR